MPTNNEKYAAISWGAPVEFDFECPSGQLCLMRKIDLVKLMEKGLLTKLDSLTSIVESEVIPQSPKDKAEAEQKQLKAATENLMKRSPEEMTVIMGLVDQVVLLSVVQPEILPIPANGSREEGAVYIDSVGFGDRMAIFGKAMEDTSNLKQFRAESGEPVGTLENVTSVQLPS